jgi:hypothetical protein
MYFLSPKFLLLWLLLLSPCFLSCHQGGRSAGTWAPLPLSPLEALKDSLSVWTGEKMIIWAGDGNSGSVNSGALYDPITGSWTLISSTDNVPSHRTDLMDFHGIWTGAQMMVWSGRSSDGEYSDAATQRVIRDDGGIYVPETDTWVAIAETDLSPGRAYVHGVWTGSQMIVWGGNHETSASGAQDLGVEEPTLGAIFTPGNVDTTSDDAWQALSTTNAPSQRKHGVVVWTGNRLLTWGGAYSHTLFYNDGASYDPETDSWTAISSIGAPSGREFSAFVWTGSKLLVWGGYNGAECLDDGALYDPSTDTWSPITTVNAPSARMTTSASWTGDEMILWGGANVLTDSDGNQSTTYLSDGAFYNPDTDTWTTMAAVDTLSGRRSFVQVWTGSQLIIWGGYNGTEYFKDGAIFTP